MSSNINRGASSNSTNTINKMPLVLVVSCLGFWATGLISGLVLEAA